MAQNHRPVPQYKNVSPEISLFCVVSLLSMVRSCKLVNNKLSSFMVIPVSPYGYWKTALSVERKTGQDRCMHDMCVVC